jgi:hypothetical protein
MQLIGWFVGWSVGWLVSLLNVLTLMVEISAYGCLNLDRTPPFVLWQVYKHFMKQGLYLNDSITKFSVNVPSYYETFFLYRTSLT